MFGARPPRVVFLALSIGLASTLFAGGAVAANLSIATAASPHRAAVIVDTGSDVHRVVVTFTEDSITGIEALQRSGANPVIYSFGGLGGAVCRLFGVGRDAGPGCLGGQDGDNRYWAYFRAPAGASSFKYSSGGAGSTRVHDGDVEGWRFGTGAAPMFVSLASLAPQPPPTTPSTRARGTAAPGSSGSTPGSTPTAAGGRPASGSPSSTALPVTGGATASGASGTTGAAGGGNGSRTSTRRSKASDSRGTAKSRTVGTALASSADESGGSSGWSLLWFGALLGALVAAIFVARRIRRGAA